MPKDNYKIYELANDLYFYYIDYLNIRDKCIIETDDYYEKTDLGRTIYFKIVDVIIENFNRFHKKKKLSSLSNSDIQDAIKQYIGTIH